MERKDLEGYTPDGLKPDPQVPQHQWSGTFPHRVEPLERVTKQLSLVQWSHLEQKPVPELVEVRVQYLPEVEEPKQPVKRVEPRVRTVTRYLDPELVKGKLLEVEEELHLRFSTGLSDTVTDPERVEVPLE